MLDVVGVAVLADNYVWLVHEPASGDTVAIDPGVAAPVLIAAQERGWRISQIWNTHWHGDHVGGNAALKAATGCSIVAPLDPLHPIPEADRIVREGDRLSLGAAEARVISTPGHTKVHVCYHLEQDSVVFTGDTLFALGCGRLFEGRPAQMFANMRRFAAMPEATKVYCAHEYTEANGRFALSVEPQNRELAARMLEVERLRSQGLPTVPTTIALERASNPFMRAADLAEFSARRAAKDAFRG